MYYLLIVGNVSLTDALLDLLNSPGEGKGSLKTKKPLISKNGFSVELEEFPTNVTFCFIMNEKDFQNRDSADSFPIPLLDRLNQLTLDYDQRDEFGIIERYKEYHDNNFEFSTPYATIIHNYFMRFIDNLNDIPESSYDDEYSNAVVYATTDIDVKSFTQKNERGPEFYEFSLGDDFDEIEWDKKIILSLYYRRTGNSQIRICKENINNFKKIDANEVNEEEDNDEEEKRYLTFYWSKEFDKLYEINKNGKLKNFEIPLPKPINYDFYLGNDGSISNLIAKIEQREIDLSENSSKQQTYRAIIVTTSPLMENIVLEEKEQNGITTNNTEFLFDQYISSAENFKERIKKRNKENIIIQLNHFQIEHDRYLRHLLEDLEDKKYTIIIYHIKNSIMPEGLYTSSKWPVFWIESITDSPLSKFKTPEIVECIRFNAIYKERMEDLYNRIFRQIYNDIDSHFEDHIDDKKVDEILNFIYLGLKEKRNANGKLILEAVNFNDLIDKFEGKKVRDSYKNLDFKREFCNAIINQVPFLDDFIHILILNKDVINNDIDTSKTGIFISKIFKYGNIEELFKKADLANNNYQHFNRDGMYFPELILPNFLSIYNVYKKKDIPEEQKVYPKIDMLTLQTFIDFQIEKKEAKEILTSYIGNYFMGYVDGNNMYKEDEFKGFYDKIVELLDKEDK